MISSGSGRFLLLDTDVFSYIIKNDTRRLRYAPLLVGYQLALSFMTIAELYQGAAINHWGAKRISYMEQVIQTYFSVMVDLDMCEIWARVRAERRAAGHPIQAQDAWVATTALRHNLPLVTNNAKDYQGITGLDVRTANP